MKVKLFPSQLRTIAQASDLYLIMRDVLQCECKADRRKEHLWTVCLDSTNKVLSIELVSLGAATMNINPADVFGLGWRKKASGIVLVQAHSNDALLPTPQDIELTAHLAAVGNFMKLPVIDHLLITGDAFYSFRYNGMLQQINENAANMALSFSNLEKLKADLKDQEQKLETIALKIVTNQKKLADTRKKFHTTRQHRRHTSKLIPS